MLRNCFDLKIESARNLKQPTHSPQFHRGGLNSIIHRKAFCFRDLCRLLGSTLRLEFIFRDTTLRDYSSEAQSLFTKWPRMANLYLFASGIHLQRYYTQRLLLRGTKPAISILLSSPISGLWRYIQEYYFRNLFRNSIERGGYHCS